MNQVQACAKHCSPKLAANELQWFTRSQMRAAVAAAEARKDAEIVHLRIELEHLTRAARAVFNHGATAGRQWQPLGLTLMHAEHLLATMKKS